MARIATTPVMARTAPAHKTTHESRGASALRENPQTAGPPTPAAVHPRPRPAGRLRAGTARFAAAISAIAVALLLAASPAWAAGKTIGSCVLEKLEAAAEERGTDVEGLLNDPNGKGSKSLDKKLERCIEAPNPIFPELNEVIWGGAAFLVLLGFMSWKGFPAVKRAMDARSQQIRDDLDSADKAKTEAQRALSVYKDKLSAAEVEAVQIIDKARAEADRLESELQARAEADIVRQRERAAAEIETTRRQAIDDLRSEVAAIAVGAAERVVGASINAKTHRKLIDGYIDEVASTDGSQLRQQ